MGSALESPRAIRFGVFEVDLQKGELRKGGLKVKLQEQPFRVLEALLERPGAIVEREELRLRLWPKDTFVDFDHSLNTAINKVRETLGDSADSPRFVETVPRRGYRFIAPVEVLGEEQREEATPLLARHPEDRGVRRERIVFIAALVVAAGVVVALWLSRPSAVPEPPVRKFTFTPEIAVDAAIISPSGRYIVYVSGEGEERSLWVQDLTGLQPRRLEGTEGAEWSLFWSLDSEHVVFAARGRLWKIPVEGGTPATICGVPPGTFTGGAWSPDGNSIVFSVTTHGIYEVPARGGTPNLIIEVDRKLGDHFDEPVFLPAPTGKRILLYAAKLTGGNHEVVVRDLETGKSEVLVSNVPGMAAYSPTGHVIYFQNGALWALPFLAAAMKPVGEAFPIANGGDLPSVALDGTLVYLQRDFRWQLVWRDRSGKKTGVVGQFQKGVPRLSLSPDGRLAAVESWASQNNIGSNVDIWVYDVLRNTRSRLTSDPSWDRTPIWHPDGNTVTFRSHRQGNWDIFSKPADGSGEAKPLMASPANEEPDDWSPDGRFLLYHVGDGDLWYLKRSESGDRFEATPFLQTPFREKGATFSPDGRFLAYVSDESGKEEVYVQRFPEGGGKEQISRNGGTQPRWREDGKELFYVEGDTLEAVPVTLRPEFSAGVARALFKDGSLRRETNVAQQKYAPSDDGQRFLLPERLEDTRGPVIRVVQNWFAEFRDRP